MPMPVARMTVARVRTWAPRAAPRVSRRSATLMTRPVRKLTSRMSTQAYSGNEQQFGQARVEKFLHVGEPLLVEAREETKMSARTGGEGRQRRKWRRTLSTL